MTRMTADERAGAGRGEGPPDVALQMLLDRAARIRRRPPTAKPGRPAPAATIRRLPPTA